MYACMCVYIYIERERYIYRQLYKYISIQEYIYIYIHIYNSDTQNTIQEQLMSEAAAAMEFTGAGASQPPKGYMHVLSGFGVLGFRVQGLGLGFGVKV